MNRAAAAADRATLDRMHGACVGLAVVAALAVASPDAHADDDDYGEQIALADTAGLALAYATARISRRTDLGVGVGLGSYLLVAPSVHLGHGRTDRAALSLGMRLVPVTALLSIGACGGGEEATACVAGHLLVTFFGTLTATAVDIFVVAEGSSTAIMPLRLGGRF